MKSKDAKIKYKKLQKDEYIFFEVGGRRTYLVHSKARKKEIIKEYKLYGTTPF